MTNDLQKTASRGDTMITTRVAGVKLVAYTKEELNRQLMVVAGVLGIDPNNIATVLIGGNNASV